MPVKDNSDEVSKGKTCMTPLCGKPAKWKMICQQCYGQAKELMEEEKLSWDDLTDMGLCITPTRKFRAEYFKRKRERVPSSDDIEEGLRMPVITSEQQDVIDANS